MGAEIPIGPLCHTPRMPKRKGDAWFWVCQNYPMCKAPTTTTPLVAQSEAANPSSQRQDPSEGMSTPPGQALGKCHGKGKLCAIISDKGEITGTSKSIQRKLVTDEGKRHSSRTVEGRTELDLVQDEVDEAKRLLEEAHVKVQAAQNKVTEAAFRVGQAMEEMARIKKLLEANLEPADQ